MSLLAVSAAPLFSGGKFRVRTELTFGRETLVKGGLDDFEVVRAVTPRPPRWLLYRTQFVIVDNGAETGRSTGRDPPDHAPLAAKLNGNLRDFRRESDRKSHRRLTGQSDGDGDE